MSIVRNPAFYGAMSNCKRSVRSYKNKTIDTRPIDEWVIIEGTHEPIVSKKLWEQAQEIKSKNARNVKKTTSTGEHNVFVGIIKCANMN